MQTGNLLELVSEYAQYESAEATEEQEGNEEATDAGTEVP